VREGSVLATGQPFTGVRAATEVLTELAEMPLPEPSPEVELYSLPGGFGNTTHGEGIVRGVGYAIGFKNLCYSEGFDDYSTARVRLSASEGRCFAEVHTAAVEVGQGLNTVLVQIARTELGIEEVIVLPADTKVGSSGSSSASRQTWMSGGAVKAACDEVKARVQERAMKRFGREMGPITLEGGKVLSADLEVLASISEMLEGGPIEETAVYHHQATESLDPQTGQGNAHVAFAFAAHRAVVDVDTELGLVRVIEVATAQDVGKAINPLGVEGQIEGGIAMGLGYAVMEEMKLRDGRILNPSLTDYIIPTILDMPQVKSRMLEISEPLAPYGVRGVGEPPTIASAPAIVAAIRAASGRPLERLPVRPEDIVGLDHG
jgi:CO/xanthine dehydrogenase Mo-binding subunit